MPKPPRETPPDAAKKRSGSETNAETPPQTPQQPAKEGTEAGGRGGLDPTRYGDWEKAGRCIDF